MTTTLRQSEGIDIRQTDVGPIIQLLNSSHCVEVTGFSNVGKSSLMRVLAHADVWLQHLGEEGGAILPVYIDCNRMLDMTEQGFYELVLRCLQESSPVLAENRELQEAYEALIAPANVFQVPLSFSNGLTAALHKSEYKLVLLFDEFDEPFQRIDTRVFLNLRAKKDRYGNRLVFVTATVRPLATLRPGDHSGEFRELFAHHPWHLAPLSRHDVERYLRRFSAQNGVVPFEEDIDFVYQWTGGHPGYLTGVSRILARAEAALDRDSGGGQNRFSFLRGLIEQLRGDLTLQSEGEKIWKSCTTEQQEALRLLFSGQEPDAASMSQLMKHHVLVREREELRAFSRLFAEYVLAHQAAATLREGLRLDEESGEVTIGGRPIDLTQLEFRLMKLLYVMSNSIVDKYEIVEGVWGDEQLLDVDDSRIEKLVSRLRQKVEPDPSEPVYITTVRGRGYRLVTD
ncbi:MAG: winged helix-turn-helix domain-containing protein [Caldilineaceae bacterium]|nr:winged helix-turn-helix domain-containing protein [Caldilineaceae bacterium]